MAGAGNRVANMAVGAANLLIAAGDISGDAELIGPVQPFTPRSNYFGRQGGDTAEGLLNIAGATGIGSAIAGRVAGAGAAAPLADELAGAAQRAAQEVGTGRGSVYGTKVHSAFERQVNALGKSDVHTEVSYLNGQVVPYGTKGSVRLDVVNGPVNAPAAVYDLKTGSATLTPARIRQIQSHIPGGSSVPVTEIRP